MTSHATSGRRAQRGFAGLTAACLAVGLLAVGAARPARAQIGFDEGSISGANQAQVWVADSSEAASYLNLFDLQYAKGPWLVAARLEFDEEARTDAEHFQGIARRWIEYRGEDATLRAGTFYATFGRGLLLRAEEDEAVRIDRNIDGAHGALRWRNLDGQAFLGRPRNDDTHERDDLLAGAEFGVRLRPQLRIGAGYVRMDAALEEGETSEGEEGALELGSPAEELFGGSVQFSHGIMEAVVEGAKRYVHGERDPRSGWIGVSGLDGRAIYGSLSLGVPGYTLLIEAKDYEKFDAPYSTLPPVNEAGQPINNGVDERGFGATLTASPRAEVTIEATGSYAEAPEADDPGERSAVQGSVRRDWWGRGALELGGEWTEEVELESHAYRRFYGPEIEASYYVSSSSSLSLHGKVQSWINEIRGGTRDEYTEITSDLTFALDPYRSAVLAIIHATEAIDEYEGDDTWISLQLAWSFGYDHDLKVKLGEERGGIVCSGGICHYEPPFSGVRIEFTSRF